MRKLIAHRPRFAPTFAAALLAAALALPSAGGALAATDPAVPAQPLTLRELDQRLSRIERVMDNKVLLDLLQRVESLQAEIRELRGEIESQGFEQQSLKKRQRDLYLDTDRRLRELELGAPATSSGDAAARGSGANLAAAAGSVAAAGDAAASGGEAAGDEAAVGAAVADPAYEKRGYEHAFKYLEQGDYDEAVRAFESFLHRYPDGRYAGHARYWQGEAYYVSRRFEQAIAAFQHVLQKHPTSPKVADARLKLGYAHYEMSQWEQARATLQRLVDDFPGTAVARLAGKRLQRMRSEGH